MPEFTGYRLSIVLVSSPLKPPFGGWCALTLHSDGPPPRLLDSAAFRCHPETSPEPPCDEPRLVTQKPTFPLSQPPFPSFAVIIKNALRSISVLASFTARAFVQAI